MAPPQTYLGLREIGRRLGCYKNTVKAWILERGLPCYRRRLGPRVTWATSESLITAWEAVQARLEQKRLRAVNSDTSPDP